ncbi:MAG: hypothetical protein K2U26_18135 [Cyclobacteriaceae bacterium]|nr:hypothetical protein [Cyclobacteriaceae bacterium]
MVQPRGRAIRSYSSRHRTPDSYRDQRCCGVSASIAHATPEQFSVYFFEVKRCILLNPSIVSRFLAQIEKITPIRYL